MSRRKLREEGDNISEKVTISREQAKIIASVITPNIKSYIQAHQTEYEAWLAEHSQKLKQSTKERETWEYSTRCQ